MRKEKEVVYVVVPPNYEKIQKVIYMKDGYKKRRFMMIVQNMRM